MMNDEIFVIVNGGASNKQVQELVGVLQAHGCIGKITATKCSPLTMAEVTKIVDARGKKEGRVPTQHGSWAKKK